jgi:hypothetical protein
LETSGVAVAVKNLFEIRWVRGHNSHSLFTRRRLFEALLIWAAARNRARPADLNETHASLQ